MPEDLKDDLERVDLQVEQFICVLVSELSGEQHEPPSKQSGNTETEDWMNILALSQNMIVSLTKPSDIDQGLEEEDEGRDGSKPKEDVGVWHVADEGSMVTGDVGEVDEGGVGTCGAAQ